MNQSIRIRRSSIVVAACLLFVPAPGAQVWSQDEVRSDSEAASGLGIRQRRYVADRLKLIEIRIASLAVELQEGEPERAKKLTSALERMSQMTLQERAVTIAAMLDKRELEHATEQQQTVLKDLTELLDLLADDDSETDRLAEKVRELREWKQRLLALRDDEADQLETSDQLAHPEESLEQVELQIAEVERLIQQQQQLINDNQKVRGTDLDGLDQIAQLQEALRAATEKLAEQIDSAPLHRAKQDDKRPPTDGPSGNKPGDKQPGDKEPDDEQPPDKPKPPGLRRKTRTTNSTMNHRTPAGRNRQEAGPLVSNAAIEQVRRLCESRHPISRLLEISCKQSVVRLASRIRSVPWRNCGERRMN